MASIPGGGAEDQSRVLVSKMIVVSPVTAMSTSPTQVAFAALSDGEGTGGRPDRWLHYLKLSAVVRSHGCP